MSRRDQQQIGYCLFLFIFLQSHRIFLTPNYRLFPSTPRHRICPFEVYYTRFQQAQWAFMSLAFVLREINKIF